MPASSKSYGQINDELECVSKGMCGRNSIGFSPADLSEKYGLSSAPVFEPSWNIAPSERSPVVTKPDQDRRCRLGLWSYCPSFGDNQEWMEKQVINARVESVGTNEAFREAWDERRCVVPSTGFYEWKGGRGSNVPMFFHQSGGIFSMAGIYTLIETSDGLEPAYAVLTRPARPPVSEIHDREPVTLRRTEVEDYLSCELSSDHLKEVEGVELRSRQASVSANNPQNTGRDVTRRTTASLEDY